MRLQRPLPPGSTIGILGSGQLGRMTALAAARLGLGCHIYAPERNSPAFQVAAAHTVSTYDDLAALARFARTVDVVTYEFENVPAATAAFFEGKVALAPGARALAVAQDRVDEKSFIASLGITVAPFAAVTDEENLAMAVAKLGRPAILKTRRLGYDGKGQVKIDTATDLAAAFAAIGKAPAILEGYVSFDKEISVIAARGWDGEVAVYDVPENVHRHHILHTSTVPARISAAITEEARELGRRIAAALDYVGVIGVEMFVGAQGLLVNEFAPRVHNSGHWTMDACLVSQFEQHVRAICGWPLGDPSRHSDAVMTNLLGDDAALWARLAAEPYAGLHLYGKTEARPGRKMGHINRLTPRQG
ncbi:MAG: 5-(carboxyamino)imidazole ribonucleotide synthase [Rhizobiales bacterium]|nr:5-(carboxyamino)imidazole ribonucleotide synthase [Hyphomicrobiales bacterium]MBI3672720.1 5-(carboxyamino)imidazole ribonucleotide synthase [Hyphomicrobiales bacterium]